MIAYLNEEDQDAEVVIAFGESHVFDTYAVSAGDETDPKDRHRVYISTRSHLVED